MDLTNSKVLEIEINGKASEHQKKTNWVFLDKYYVWRKNAVEELVNPAK